MYFKYKYKFLIVFIIFIKYFNVSFGKLKKKVGIIGLAHSQNIGNNLVKYSIFIKLIELGYTPYIVGTRFRNHNISFILDNVNLRLIKNFSEIKENDFDILIVNSDQTWNAYTPNFENIGLLKFAEKWNKTKFIYATSLGFQDWKFSKKYEKMAKNLLPSFSGISVREKYSVKLIKTHLGFNSQFVLDPTFLIDKKYYLNLIKDFKSDIINQINNKNYIFAYILKNSSNIKNYISYVKKKLNTSIFYITIHTKNQVKEFLYGISNCKAVITNSFHGGVFSIIFKKPFVFFLKTNDDIRFNNLMEVFDIKGRMVKVNTIPSIELIEKPLIFNESKLITLKEESIDYLKSNLNYNSN